jgi:hypothetical protein
MKRLFLVAVLMMAAPLALSQELEPRSYVNLPVGETFMVLGAVRSEGDISPTPSSPLQEADLTIDVGILGLAHTFAIADKAAKIDMLFGRTCYEGSGIFQGEFVEGRRCEYTDPSARLTWNFYGAPAMPLKDFMQWEPGLVIGTSLQVIAPVGTYNGDNLINAGGNRWVVRPGLGLSFRTGRWHYDISTTVKFFEDNDDFFGGNNREQDPLYALQFHLVRYFNRGRWISLNGNFYSGGQSSVNGDEVDDRQENSRWGVTFSMPVTPRNSVKLYASTGVVTKIGSDFDSYGIAWQYRF